MYKEVLDVVFPKSRNIHVNMMPIIMNDWATVPEYLLQYKDLISLCGFESGSTVYLSIHESFVRIGDTQRRPGIHTEAVLDAGWGGGWGGKDRGLYMASNDGRCKLWNCLIEPSHPHGSLDVQELSLIKPEITKPNKLYWLTDKTPHEALSSTKSHVRQWFRLVSEDIDIWFAKHSTENPLGIKPKANISYENKFQ